MDVLKYKERKVGLMYKSTTGPIRIYNLDELDEI